MPALSVYRLDKTPPLRRLYTPAARYFRCAATAAREEKMPFCLPAIHLFLCHHLPTYHCTTSAHACLPFLDLYRHLPGMVLLLLPGHFHLPAPSPPPSWEDIHTFCWAYCSSVVPGSDISSIYAILDCGNLSSTHILHMVLCRPRFGHELSSHFSTNSCLALPMKPHGRRRQWQCTRGVVGAIG